ncbi:MAG: PD40 domain-containing protein [Chthonomonadaceae bacterium]|nr:PD40 domain-containing protein [Chthonomonadaceae bacterium]
MFDKRVPVTFFLAAATGGVMLTSACAGEGSGDVNSNDLESLVVWVKGNSTSGGKIYAKSLVGDLASSQSGELFPASTKNRQTPYLSIVSNMEKTVALYWVEQAQNSSVIHRYVVNSENPSQDEIIVNDGAYASSPASDNAQSVWYSSNVSGSSQIYRLGSSPIKLTTQGGFAPDVYGFFVVFSNNIGNFEIFKMNSTDGSGLVNLTNNAAADINPRVSPDGQKIVFASNRTGKYQIYMMNRDGSNVVRLTNHSADDATPSFSADMKYVVYASRLDGDWDIYALNLATKVETNLTHDNIDDRSPHCGEFKLSN